MRLYIAEKPDLARAIADALGGGARGNGFIQVGADRVTWCFGHMLQLLVPEDYDINLKRWRMEDLPIINVPWRKKPGKDKGEQLDVIKGLLAQAQEVVHAGDPDDEGQLLVDEVIADAGYRGPVWRVLINDNNKALVQRALGALRPNEEFAGLSAAAEARQVADQMVGFNLSRAYTLAARARGAEGLWTVGRVQTPVLGLVVRRDRAHAGHVAVFYYVVGGSFTCESLRFRAVYQVAPGDPVDDEGRLCDATAAERIASACRGRPAVVESAVTTAREEPPPLPYNLLGLQIDASRKWGYKPDAVKDITQELREKHKLITYNRSDSRYLSDEQHGDAAEVLAAIAATAPGLAAAATRGNPGLKSRAFNSSKVTAHHAIIPTGATAQWGNLTEGEQRIYMLIARAYIAQFFPNHWFDQTEAILRVKDQHRFACHSRVTTSPGWKNLYRNDGDADETVEDEADTQVDIRKLAAGQHGHCEEVTVDKRATKPPPLYTMATLLKDLTRVARYVRDQRLRDLLIAKDKAKPGEHGGIGTPATRDSIVMTLLKRGFLEENKKHLTSTRIGQEFYDGLPDTVRFPDMTALWHEQQEAIRQGKLTTEAFLKDLAKYVTAEVERVRKHGLALTVTAPPCPACGKPLARRSGNNGKFWGCTGYNEGCTFTADDNRGKPVLEPKDAPGAGKHQCPACGSPMRQRTGPTGPFWSCTTYPTCKATLPDDGAKPPKAGKAAGAQSGRGKR